MDGLSPESRLANLVFNGIQNIGYEAVNFHLNWLQKCDCRVQKNVRNTISEEGCLESTSHKKVNDIGICR